MGSRAKSRRFLGAVAERAPRFIATTNLAATVSPSIAFVGSPLFHSDHKAHCLSGAKPALQNMPVLDHSQTLSRVYALLRTFPQACCDKIRVT